MNVRSDFAERIERIVGGERVRQARFGCMIQRLDDGRTLFARDAEHFFGGASTTKIPTVAGALAALGPDFRFRTVVRHTGTLDEAGTLHGDLVLVGSGDPNLSARVRADDTLAFNDVDHALSGFPGAAAVAGDPLVVLRALATAVARNVKRVSGRVRVDVGIFPEGAREGGTQAVISPIVVNDNLVDVLVQAGGTPGDALVLSVQPETSYVRFVCEGTTGEPDSIPRIVLSSEIVDEAGGSCSVRISGTLPPGHVQLYAHPVSSPSAFARSAFARVLDEAGVRVEGRPSTNGVAESAGDRVVAEHWSPPFAQAAKVILKVSQNMHAELCPRVTGVYAAGVRGDGAEAAGYARLRDVLASTIAGFDDGIAQGDGCGVFGYYTPAFMCRLLRTIAGDPALRSFRDCLPVLGRDGTLATIVPTARAAGNVVAKTGTYGFEDRLDGREFVAAKGLAGYIDTMSGDRLVFAAYINNVKLQPGETAHVAGTMLGELAAAAYEYF